MAISYKVLGQVNPVSATLTTLYTVPGGTQTIGSSISICNQGTATTYRIAIRPAGAAIDPKHYIAYNAPIEANDTAIITFGLTIAATDVVSVYAGSSNVSFNLFGSEVI